MSEDNLLKVGVVSCSGEDYLGGTISRLATRKVLEETNAGETVTICLPLFLAGGEEERGFADEHPVISVDGCSKYCAKRATEKYSGKVSASLNVADIIDQNSAESSALSCRDLTDEHVKMVDKITEAIKVKIDEILGKDRVRAEPQKAEKIGSRCACGGK